MNEADRIARDQLRAERAAAAGAESRRVAQAAADAAAELDTIRSLSREVLAKLAQDRYRDPGLESLELSVYRFPPVGELFGYRRVVKGGWKIAEWKYDREKPGHKVWLLADGRYCWNRQIVSSSTFDEWYKRPFVSQGPGLMIEGLEELKERLVSSSS